MGVQVGDDIIDNCILQQLKYKSFYINTSSCDELRESWCPLVYFWPQFFSCYTIFCAFSDEILRVYNEYKFVFVNYECFSFAKYRIQAVIKVILVSFI